MSNTQYNFKDYKKDSLTKPRDLTWTNWAKFEKVGDKIMGYIRDVFYRPSDGLYKEQRGITLEQESGEMINVGIKRLPFILNKTDDMRLGDPLVIELTELKKPDSKGLNPTKIYSFFGKSLPENAENKTVRELEAEDIARGGTAVATGEEDKEEGEKKEDLDF
jgi:hypothetical protein